MFVRNRSRYRATLARGLITDLVRVAAPVIESAYRIEPTGLHPVEIERPDNLPDLGGYPLWTGVSVTASGAIFGPPRPPFVRTVTLAVGAATCTLLVVGDRRWAQGSSGEMIPSEPARFDRIALSFERAFGGAFEVPPGIDPQSRLPSPGAKVCYPWNHVGIGFYPDRETAFGAPLPNIELASDRIKRWDDRPEPGGISPCPSLAALRVVKENPVAFDRGAQLFEMALRQQHHAPGSLIFPRVPPGTQVRLEGVGDRPISFSVPPSPVRVYHRRARQETEVAATLRAIHVDADRGTMFLVHGHPFKYTSTTAPAWVRIAEA